MSNHSSKLLAQDSDYLFNFMHKIELGISCSSICNIKKLIFVAQVCNACQDHYQEDDHKDLQILLYPPKRWILWIWPEYAASAAAAVW